MSSFECAGCHQQFKEVNTGVRGEYWCNECYNYKTCAKCGDPITRNMIIFKSFEGKDYHRDCFKCGLCRNPIKKNASNYEGKIICAECAEPCAGCGKPIGKKFLEACDKKYHEECVKCQKCKRNIANESFFEENGEPICQQCCDCEEA